jgi:PAS domain S-box-containing protein
MKLSMGAKIFAGFLAVMLAFGGVFVYSILRLHSLGGRLQQLADLHLPLSKVASQLENAQHNRRTDVTRVLEVADPDSRARLIRHTSAGLKRAVSDRTRFARASIDRAARAGLLPADDQWIAGIRERLDRIDRLNTQYEDAVLNMFAAIEAGEGPVQGTDSAVRDGDQRLTRELRLLAGQMEARISSIAQAARREEMNTTWGVIIWSLIALVVAIAMVVLSQLTLSPLSTLREKVAQIARGNYFLRTGMASDDEVGLLARAVDDMAQSLQQRQREAGEASDKLLRATADLRRANADLLVLRAYSENIFRSIRSAILALDERGAITTANPAAEALWGFSAKDAAGKKVADLPGWTAAADVGEAIERAMLGRTTVELEAVSFGQGPECPLVDLKIAPLQGEGGELKGALVIGEDVTEKTRTKQLLIQSERLAAIGRIAAQITHEIRNPLSAIGLDAELLDESIAKGEAPEARRLLSAIQSEIGRLSEITEEYLRFARMPSGRRARVDINEAMRDLTAFMSIEMARGNVRARCEFGDDVPAVEADAGQLRQAFMNILRNAIEAMPSGGELVVRTRGTDGGAVVTFSDTGQGIAPGHLGRVFDPFFSTKEAGIGLGLSLTQQIIAEHGGAVRVESKPGRGSTFTVTLPAAGE